MIVLIEGMCAGSARHLCLLQIGEDLSGAHIELEARSFGLTRDSVVLLEQIRTIDKRRLRERMGRVDDELMNKVDDAIAVSFGLHG